MPAFTNICIIIADTIKYYKQIISQETDVNKYGQLLQVTSTSEFIFYLNLFDDLWFNDDDMTSTELIMILNTSCFQIALSIDEFCPQDTVVEEVGEDGPLLRRVARIHPHLFQGDLQVIHRRKSLFLAKHTEGGGIILCCSSLWRQGVSHFPMEYLTYSTAPASINLQFKWCLHSIVQISDPDRESLFICMDFQYQVIASLFTLECSFAFRLKTELGTNWMDKTHVYFEFYFHF